MTTLGRTLKAERTASAKALGQEFAYIMDSREASMTGLSETRGQDRM